jgi:Family of unknown function (DUF6459)
MNSHANAISDIETWVPLAQPPRPRHLHLVRAATDPVIEPDRRWVEHLTQSVVEVLGGRRSATTLVRALSPAVFQALRTPQGDAPLPDGRVISVRMQPLGDDSVEVAAVVGAPDRTRALALRLHRRHDRWRCVCVAVL